MNRSEKESLLSIILPAYNEAAIIKDVVMDYFCEISTKLPSTLVVAEDGSTDGTRDILFSLKNEIPISIFSYRQRKGFAKGVCDALRKCNEDWIFFSDSDGQYFPSDFWSLWEKRHDHDMIIGRKTNRGDCGYRVVLSRVFHNMVNRLFGLGLKDVDCGFRLIKKDVIRSVLDETWVLKYSFWTEFTVKTCLKGFRVCEVPISHAGRNNGGTRIYKLSMIPLIIFEQLRGLLALYAYTKKNKPKVY
jgi:glycosyltransferase involved in cell wall biosynthesis